MHGSAMMKSNRRTNFYLTIGQQETRQNIICSLGSYRTENTACTFRDQLINAFGEITSFIPKKTMQTPEQINSE